MSHFISCSDTAKLLRKALKQAFPEVKFSVKSKTYAGGASINVTWVDGPCDALVNAVAKRFSGAFFDGMRDYQGTKNILYFGQLTTFGADYVNTARSFSDEQINKAIESTYRRYGWILREAGADMPSAADYRSGALYSVTVGQCGDLQGLIRSTLYKMSDRLTAHSALAANVMHIGNDGVPKELARAI